MLCVVIPHTKRDESEERRDVACIMRRITFHFFFHEIIYDYWEGSREIFFCCVMKVNRIVVVRCWASLGANLILIAAAVSSTSLSRDQQVIVWFTICRGIFESLLAWLIWSCMRTWTSTFSDACMHREATVLPGKSSINFRQVKTPTQGCLSNRYTIFYLLGLNVREN